MCNTTGLAQPPKRKGWRCRFFLFINCDVTKDRNHSQEFVPSCCYHTTHAKQVPIYLLKSDWKESFLSYFYVSKKPDIIGGKYAK